MLLLKGLAFRWNWSVTESARAPKRTTAPVSRLADAGLQAVRHVPPLVHA